MTGWDRLIPVRTFCCKLSLKLSLQMCVFYIYFWLTTGSLLHLRRLCFRTVPAPFVKTDVAPMRHSTSARRGRPALSSLQDLTNVDPAAEAVRTARREAERARQLTLQDSPSRRFRRTPPGTKTKTATGFRRLHSDTQLHVPVIGRFLAFVCTCACAFGASLLYQS